MNCVHCVRCVKRKLRIENMPSVTDRPFCGGEIKASEAVRKIVHVRMVALVTQIVVPAFAALPARAKVRFSTAHVACRTMLVTYTTMHKIHSDLKAI